MKHTRPNLTRDLLCFLRDRQPTIEEFLARFDDPGGQQFHVLRKSGVINVQDGRAHLNPKHLLADGQQFLWENHLYHLDRDEVWHICWKLPEST